MTNRKVPIVAATGHLLASAVYTGSARILRRGHFVTTHDVETLRLKGVREVSVVHLCDDDISEADCLASLSDRLLHSSLERAPQKYGAEAEFFSQINGVVQANTETIKSLNLSGAGVVALRPPMDYVHRGQRVAKLRVRPFACSSLAFKAALNAFQTDRPAIEVLPFKRGSLGFVYVDPMWPDNARQAFERRAVQMCEEFGVHYLSAQTRDAVPGLISAIQHLREKASVIVIATTVAPILPNDHFGLAVRELGGSVDTFMVPIDPGMLLFSGEIADANVLCVPGALRNKGGINALQMAVAWALAGLTTSIALRHLPVGGLIQGEPKPKAERGPGASGEGGTMLVRAAP